MTDEHDQPGATERKELLAAVATNIRAALARDEGEDPIERVVLALDTRDPLGAALAARARCPREFPTLEAFEARLVEEASAVGRFTEEEADHGRVPMIFATIDRASAVYRLNEAGEQDAADKLEFLNEAAVALVAFGGVTVQPVADA